MKEEIRTFKFYEKLILINIYKSTNLSVQIFMCRAWSQKKVYRRVEEYQRTIFVANPDEN